MNIIDQNTSMVPLMGLNPDLLNPPDLQKCEDLRSEADQSTESETKTDQDILESIEKIYLTIDGGFDSPRYELEKLPTTLLSKEIEKRYKKLKQQHQVVSTKVYNVISEKQSACNSEVEKIQLLEQQLQDVLEICRIGRADLQSAKRQFTTASLGILANYRKRQVVQELLNNLNTIKTLQRTGDRLQELLKEENYPGAISLLLECQSAAKTYKHFHCIAELNKKLQDILEQAEEVLRCTLSKMCTQFDVAVYSSVQEAYALLGKTQFAIDQLHMDFTAAIHNTAFAVIHSFAGDDVKKQYKQLCQSVPREKCVDCLTELCKSLWTIMSSYYLVVNWHNAHDDKADCKTDVVKDLEITFSKQYVKHKLEKGTVRMWHDVEMKISTYLSNIDLTFTKFEHFVQVLGVVNRLMEIGEELCGFKSKDLQDSIKKQSLSYFFHHHASRLDELRIFLENDGWELCPVKSNFVATQLQEFRSLKPSLNNCKAWNSLDSSNLSDSDNSTGIDMQKYFEGGLSPFTIGLDDTIDEDILINDNVDHHEYFSDESDDDIPDELKREYVDEPDHVKTNKKKCKLKQSGPMVTNTTLSVLRVCGKYLQMSRLLRSIAVTVIQSMIQFFELCFYTVHLFFTSDLQINSDSLYSPKLKLSLTRIRENLIISENDTMEDSGNVNYDKVRQPQLSSIVNLSQPEKLYGLTERIVAVESLIFLGQQYEGLRPYLEHLIVNSPQRGFLHQFYMQTIASAADLRKPVYMAVASQAFDVANVLNLMNKVNWEVTDVMSQHSGYIDALIQQVCVLNERLNTIGTYIPLSADVCGAVWENVAHLITHTLVEGFSNAKKCSNGGRALMQLDFTQLRSKFEKITLLRPMPHREYVELYIKAYYLPESSFEEWIKEHKEYSVKHLVGLISATCQNNKKTRQRLIALVEEQRLSR
ncbi:syndetin isoform X2 [Pseudomyrmex gracilis]|uniref:syndetin isoform X2 n=1 Tax=Pseudomyrmex gracilis TaxID=219809 RepID=UPI000994A4B5|nr:syndetin isoform X2 [Pseudomyrmex gracilis]